MPPEAVDFRSRAQLTERMDQPCSRDELRACLRDLARLNRWFLGYRPTLQWLDSLNLDRNQPVRIIDVGCGYGDGLRQIESWASKRNILVNLTGIDINSDAINIAEEASSASSRIQWFSSSVFSFQLANPVHIVISSLFTHHLVDSEIVQFLRWMEQNARVGWFINDLSRSAASYRFLGWFSKVAALHPFVQHDGPVSIARSFRPEDWKRLCSAAGFDESHTSIMGFTPARLCVGRRKR
jgi:2-polyprenyl-3-methyl-5-hydroxy-6-metoxy-1,4-benzoquinol methylase